MINNIDEDIIYYLNDKNELQIEIKYKGNIEKIEPSKLYNKDGNNETRTIYLKDNKYMIEKNIKFQKLISGIYFQFIIYDKLFSFFINQIPIKIYKTQEIYYICNSEHLSAIINRCPDKFKFYKHSRDINWKRYDKALLYSTKFYKSLTFTNDISLYEYREIFDSTLEMYNIYRKINQTVFVQEINPLILSLNFFKYYPTNSEENIKIILSEERLDFYYEIYSFFINDEKVKNKKNEKDEDMPGIFKAYTGPYGIGKSFTILMLQKMLYFEGFKTLYINLKYYNGDDSLITKLKVLWKEIFYLFFKKEDYINFLENIITSYNTIFDAINGIINSLNKNNEKYLIIIDQYQKKFDFHNRINTFRKICKKILLISSINDTDVKSNIEAELKGTVSENNINYTYIFKLIVDKTNIEKYDDTKKKMIEKFGYLPIYQYRLKKLYNLNFLDFYQKESIKIYHKIENFFNKNERSFLNKLYNENSINLQENAIKSKISFSTFVDKIQLIPLKYINYFINEEKLEVILYYAFPLIKKILQEYFKYNNNYNTYYNTNNKGQLGNTFEEIISNDFIINKLFKIDSFLKVDKILDMNPTEISEEFKEYYKQKKRIFIIQNEFGGDYFDFGVILTEEQVLILIQAKYKIPEKLEDKAYYSKKGMGIKDKVNKKLGITINTVHFLYFSSVEYNNVKVFEILKKKNIECYFYCPKKKVFFRDLFLQNPVEDFKLTTKTKISGTFINSEILFTPIKFFHLNKMPIEAIEKKENKYINQIKNNLIEDELLKKQYEQFIEYLKANQFLENKIRKFGIFLRFGKGFPDDIYRFNNIEYYLLVCSINNNGEINFNMKSYVIFCENQVNYIYDLMNGRRENQQKFEENLGIWENNNYNFFQGYWNNN